MLVWGVYTETNKLELNEYENFIEQNRGDVHLSGIFSIANPMLTKYVVVSPQATATYAGVDASKGEVGYREG